MTLYCSIEAYQIAEKTNFQIKNSTLIFVKILVQCAIFKMVHEYLAGKKYLECEVFQMTVWRRFTRVIGH